MSIFAVLVVILIWLLIFAAIVYAVDRVPAFVPVKPYIHLILALMAIVLLLSLLFGWVPIPGHFRL